jgi:hypothetical protein
VVEDTDQSALGGFADTDVNDAANQLVLTTTSGASDLVFAAARIDSPTVSCTFTGLTELDGAAVGICHAAGNADSVTIDFSSTDNVSAVAFIMPDAGAGELTGAPTVTAQDTNDYTISGTTDAAVTISAVVCEKDDAAPSIAQIVAGSGGCTVLATQSESWNGSDNFIIGGSLTFPIHDLYVTDGTTRYTLADEALDVPSEKDRVTLTSVHATSPYTGQGVATGDICTYDEEARTVAATPDPSGYAVTGDVDGTVSYAAGGDTSRRFIVSQCYDISSPQLLDFLLVYNNQAPETLFGPSFFSGALFERSEDPATDLADSASDAEGDDIDFTVTSGALPTDWALDSETGVISDGTPGACGDFTFTIRMTDTYGSTTDIPNSVTIGFAIPDVSGLTEAQAIAAIAAPCS